VQPLTSVTFIFKLAFISPFQRTLSPRTKVCPAFALPFAFALQESKAKEK